MLRVGLFINAKTNSEMLINVTGTEICTTRISVLVFCIMYSIPSPNMAKGELHLA